MVASHTPPTGDLAATQACALTGNPTGDPLVHRPALNPLSPHQPGLSIFERKKNIVLKNLKYQT